MNLKVLAAVAVCVALVPGLAPAASPAALIGDWRGSFEVRGTEVSIVWHVGADEVTVDSQGTVNLPGSAGVNGTAYTLGVPAVGAHFEGALSGDGKTLSGLYYAPGANPPLTLNRTSTTATLPVVKPAAAAIRGEWTGTFTTPNGPVVLAFHLTERPTADLPGAAGPTPVSADKTGDDYSIVVAGARFTGKLSADGKTLTGTFGRGPLTLTRR